MDSSSPSDFTSLGVYSNPDARKLLDAFRREGIRFQAKPDAAGLRTMSLFQASRGGTFGLGAGVAVVVHRGDRREAERVRERVLKIQT